MKLIADIESRLVCDWRNVMKWKSAQAISVGAAFSALAFSLSMSSAGMQFIGVFGIRIALAICLVIFISAFIGRVWSQPKLREPKDDESDKAGC